MQPQAPPAPTTSDQALSNINQFQQSMQSPAAIYDQNFQQLGGQAAQQQVSGLRQAITNTTNLLNNVPSSVMGRTANSLVTSAQANKQIQNEQAPIAKDLSDQTTKEQMAESDLDKLLAQVGTKTTLAEQGQQNHLNVLKSIYDALFGKEQEATRQREAAAAADLERQKFAEAIREFNADLALKKSTAGSGGIGSLFGGAGGGGGTNGPSMSQRSGGGFNFTDAAGRPISAAKYAQLTGNDIASVLRAMAQHGDNYAANAYASLGKVKNAKAKANVVKNFNALFWGA